MQLARIVGNAVATHAHPSLRGHAMFLCQPIDKDGLDDGDIVVAINPIGGGLGSTVLITADGSEARACVGDKKSPLRHIVVAVADE